MNNLDKATPEDLRKARELAELMEKLLTSAKRSNEIMNDRNRMMDVETRQTLERFVNNAIRLSAFFILRGR